jgi:hypothetical protein
MSGKTFQPTGTLGTRSSHAPQLRRALQGAEAQRQVRQCSEHVWLRSQSGTPPSKERSCPLRTSSCLCSPSQCPQSSSSFPQHSRQSSHPSALDRLDAAECSKCDSAVGALLLEKCKCPGSLALSERSQMLHAVRFIDQQNSD